VGQWVATTNFVGTVARASTTLRLDNIVVIEPARPPTVKWGGASGAGNLELIWERGTLQEATNVCGPWTSSLASTSPLTIMPTGPRRFFRVQWP
jgi:hypothetical protein